MQQVLTAFAPLLNAIAAVALGDDEPREAVEEALTGIEAHGWQLTSATQRIWQGERDATALTHGIDENSALLVRDILARMASMSQESTRQQRLATLPADLQAAIAAGDQAALSAAFDAIPEEQREVVVQVLTDLGIIAPREPAGEMATLLANARAAVDQALADDRVDRAALHAQFVRTIGEIEAQTADDPPCRLVVQRLHDLIAELDTAPPPPARSTADHAADAIAALDAHIAAVLTDPAVDHAQIIAYLDERAAYFADGEDANSPWLAVAAHFRERAAQVAAHAA